MSQKRKLIEESDSGGEGEMMDYDENNNGLVAPSKRRIFSVPNESSSTWFEEMFLGGDGEETRSGRECNWGSGVSGTSLAIPEALERGGEVGGLTYYTESFGTRDKRRRDVDLDELLCSPPSKKLDQLGLETDDSGSETGSDEVSENICNFSNPFAQPVRKIYLSPDRYAEYIAKIEKEEQHKKRIEAAKKHKPWELRTRSERGPRAGRSDEFATEEEAQYAENIMRAAARHRLETWHRERHEMWGLKPIQDPVQDSEEDSEEEEDEEEDEEDEGMQTDEKSDCGSPPSDLETLLDAPSICQEDMKDEATIEEVLEGLPGRLDPCFNNPADTIFLPRIPKFTEVAFSLEFRLGYTRKQVRWLMGGARSGRGEVPSSNTLAMRIKRYMDRNGLADTIKLAPATAAAKESNTSRSTGKPSPNSDSDDDDDSGGRSYDRVGEPRPLLPHGPRIPRPELGVHGWVWDHPHEEVQNLRKNPYYYY
ncbi:unnamed protein product [Tuber aestivum]|uniref:Uncharacterized protein n=1 Tax=Tuber aestivum TaxID=59557 RepID=A0A292Q6M8_9PEZI|nr:unnamed protein product [Tuber aestivum]